MDTPTCNVVYLDRRAREPRTFSKNQSPLESLEAGQGRNTAPTTPLSPAEEVDKNVAYLLSTFSHVFVYTSGASCCSCITSILQKPVADTYTLVLIEIPYEDAERKNQQSGLASGGELYGMQFLSQIVANIQFRKLSDVVIPVALTCREAPVVWVDEIRSRGASDVLIGPITAPLSASQVQELVKNAKRSDPTTREQHFKSMTQDMIAQLLVDLCDPSRLDVALVHTDLVLDPARRQIIGKAFGSWDFPAHDFAEDELLYGVLMILQHALKKPELEKWRVTEDELIRFLIATRKAYNSSVIYHNFRHACDVLQAVFHFLVSIGALAPLVEDQGEYTASRSPLAALITPVHALTLLIAAIGHDVGHPGVNNVFLVKVKATVARLYNDHSVLESYHCAASSQILERFWPEASSDIVMRKLMISTILATDMTLHSQYTLQLDALQKRFAQNGRQLKETDERLLENDRELICCLLIKCADICNVARTFNIAKHWARLVTDEFAHQGVLEKDANIPSCLFGGPPNPEDVADMANRQLGFMNIFAHDLFSRMSDILPAMQFTVDNINANKQVWQRTLAAEEQKRSSSAVQSDILESSENLDPQEVVAEQAHRTQSGDSEQVRPGQPQEVPDQQLQTEARTLTQPQAVRPAPPRDTQANSPRESISSFQFPKNNGGGRPLTDSATPRKPYEFRDRDFRDARRASSSPSNTPQEVTSRRSSSRFQVPGAHAAPSHEHFNSPNIITSLRVDGINDNDPGGLSFINPTLEPFREPQQPTDSRDPNPDEAVKSPFHGRRPFSFDTQRAFSFSELPNPELTHPSFHVVGENIASPVGLTHTSTAIVTSRSTDFPLAARGLSPHSPDSFPHSTINIAPESKRLEVVERYVGRDKTLCSVASIASISRTIPAVDDLPGLGTNAYSRDVSMTSISITNPVTPSHEERPDLGNPILSSTVGSVEANNHRPGFGSDRVFSHDTNPTILNTSLTSNLKDGNFNLLSTRAAGDDHREVHASMDDNVDECLHSERPVPHEEVSPVERPSVSEQQLHPEVARPNDQSSDHRRSRSRAMLRKASRLFQGIRRQNR